MDAALKIVVGADVNGAVSGLKQVEQASKDVSAAVGKSTETFNIQNSVLNQSVGYQRQQAAAAQKTAQAETDLANATKMANQEMSSGGGFATLLEGANKAYSAVRRLAYILPGIGVAGIFNLAFEAIGSAFKGAEKPVDDAAKALEDYNKKVDEAVSSTAKEAVNVEILVTKIQSGTLSRQETITAIKELQKIAPDYFGKLNAEKSSIEDVTKAYAAYNAQIVKTIESQIHIAELTDIVKQRLAQSEATPEAAKFVDDLISKGLTLEQIRDRAVKGTADDIRNQALLLQQNKNLTDEQLKQLLIQSKIPAGVLDIIALRQKEFDITQKIDDQATQHLARLSKEKPVKPELDPQHEALRLGTFLDTSNFDENIKVFQGKLDKHPLLLRFRADIEKSMEQAQALQKMVKEINKDIHAAEVGGLDNLFESIGGAIGRGENIIEAAGKSLLSTFGTLIENLGKSLLEYGLAQEAVQIALDSFSPEIAIIAGGVAIAAGAALKALATKGGAHAFAEGGIVTGPTVGLVGEAGPEVIFPLDKLNKFVRSNTGQNNVNVAGEFVLRGPNLVAAISRANKNQGLV